VSLYAFYVVVAQIMGLIVANIYVTIPFGLL